MESILCVYGRFLYFLVVSGGKVGEFCHIDPFWIKLKLIFLAIQEKFPANHPLRQSLSDKLAKNLLILALFSHILVVLSMSFPPSFKLLKIGRKSVDIIRSVTFSLRYSYICEEIIKNSGYVLKIVQKNCPNDTPKRTKNYHSWKKSLIFLFKKNRFILLHISQGGKVDILFFHLFISEQRKENLFISNFFLLFYVIINT